MTRTGPQRRARRAALLPLVLLAIVTGFVFAGTGLESAPPTDANESAARVAAVRIALDMPLFESPAPAAELVEPQPLLAGEDHIELSQSATRIRIASLEIDVEVRPVGYVFEQGELRYDVPRVSAGQYGTATPGEAGNTVIGGHVATRSGPAVFERLPEARLGETVEVFRGGEVFRYLITEIRVVAPDATAVMAQTQDATLTLITCSPDQNYQNRFVVIGKLL